MGIKYIGLVDGVMWHVLSVHSLGFIASDSNSWMRLLVCGRVEALGGLVLDVSF